VVLESEIDRREVAERLMGSPEIVLDEPLGEPPVEQLRVVRHIAEGEEFVLECAVETFVHRVVLGGFDTGPVMRKTHLLTGIVEVQAEFAPVISLNIIDLSI
jgi:hypothetical protein